MKNITLSADENLINWARDKAAREKTTLNQLFRDWLSQYTGAKRSSSEYLTLMKRLSHVQSNRKYSRDEMNER